MFCNSNNEFVFCFLKKRRPHLRITEGKKGLCYISVVQICVNLGEGSACVCVCVPVCASLLWQFHPQPSLGGVKSKSRCCKLMDSFYNRDAKSYGVKKIKIIWNLANFSSAVTYAFRAHSQETACRQMLEFWVAFFAATLLVRCTSLGAAAWWFYFSIIFFFLSQLTLFVKKRDKI